MDYFETLRILGWSKKLIQNQADSAALLVEKKHSGELFGPAQTLRTLSRLNARALSNTIRFPSERSLFQTRP
jgi:hypothetical protein